MAGGRIVAGLLAKRSKKILEKIDAIEALDARGRHKLRTAVNKLRYACEFFACLFTPPNRWPRRKRSRTTLKSL